MNDILKQIKQEFRLAMNGVASTRMRESGLVYKINFGIELPRLESIAADLPHEFSLSQTLWNENIRESKILGLMLMPTECFDVNMAELWVEQVPNIEIARLYVQFLLKRLPYAMDLSFRWIASSHDWRQICGFLLMSRLLMQGTELSESAMDELRDQAAAVVNSQNLFLRQAATNVYMRIS